MKRLVCILCAAVLALSLSVGFAFIPTDVSNTASAKAKKEVYTSVDALLGQPVSASVKLFGAGTRTDPSEYGFGWTICNRSYKKFAMVGVDGGAIVALYTNMPKTAVSGNVSIGMPRGSVRAVLGQPITYIQTQSTTYIIPNTEVKDVFTVGDYYYTVFYDQYNACKVDSFLLVKKSYEEALVDRQLSYDDNMGLAYARESYDLLNSARAVRGKSVLKWSQPVADLSNSRSTDMRDRDYFDHFTPEGRSPADNAKAAGVKYKSLGENIACGHRDAIMANEAFLNSAGHRSNMLSTKYTSVGTGVACGGKRFVILTCTFIK